MRARCTASVLVLMTAVTSGYGDWPGWPPESREQVMIRQEVMRRRAAQTAAMARSEVLPQTPTGQTPSVRRRSLDPAGGAREVRRGRDTRAEQRGRKTGVERAGPTTQTTAVPKTPIAQAQYHDQAPQFLPEPTVEQKEITSPPAVEVLEQKPSVNQPVILPACASLPCDRPSNLPCCDLSCGPVGRFWVRGDHLLWWARGQQLPSLVTTAPIGTPRASAGVLGQPGTRILFGDTRVDGDERQGGRILAGFWIDSDQLIGLEGSFFMLEEEGTESRKRSAGDPIVARPFFNAATGSPDALFVAFPDSVLGNIRARTTSDLWGSELYLRSNLCCDRCYRVDLLGGYRFLHLDEDVRINEMEISPAAGTRFDMVERFETENEFHGGQIGLASEFRKRRWVLEVFTKLAIGAVHQEVVIDGTTVRMATNQPTTTRRGGFLTQPTNVGHYGRTEFGFVPELGVNLAYQIVDHCRAYVGYTFIYWSDVARPGDQVEVVINPTQILGPLQGASRPAFRFREEDFWVQGLNAGLELRF